MKLIVGLGNPGDKYKDTRHNLGFNVVSFLAKEYGLVFKKEPRVSALSARGDIEGEEVVLFMPLTFMNLSGSAVGLFFKNKNLDLKDMLVVCDDLDLDLGRFKIKNSGSSGGHNGLESLMATLGTGEFARLRVGIGRPPLGVDSADYVLSSFLKSEKPVVKDLIENAASTVKLWIKSGLPEAMNKCNRKQTKENKKNEQV